MPSISFSPPMPSLKEQLVRESCAMVRHLVTNGSRVPSAVVQSADQFEAALEQNQAIDVTALAVTHERLSRLVAPSKPGTLYLLDYGAQQQGRDASSLGPIKLVRDLVRVAMVCVGIFIVLSVLSVAEVHPRVAVFDGLALLEIIMQRVFWLSAAGIGAAFAMLFTVNDQIVSRTYDPDETASYWVKFFLGVVAGFILVALVPIDTTADTGAEAIAPPTIAMLGGFSASAVYRILTRMVEALESVFAGGAKEQTAMAEKLAAARSAEEGAQSRMAVAGQLVEIQQQIAAGMPAEQAAAQLRQVVATLVPTAAEVPEPRAAAPGKVPALAIVADPADGGAAADEQGAAAPAPSPAAAG